MAYETIKCQADGGIALVTLNRPERLNAYSDQMLKEMERLIEGLEGDAAVRVVIITGEGRAFSAGADIHQWAEQGGQSAVHRTGRLAQRTFRRLERLEQVVLAAINGYAAGGGLELALACDLRIASEAALLALPEVKLGILPGAGGTQRLPRLIGAGRAKEMMFFGDFISAHQALLWGLVNRVVPQQELLPTAYDMARELSERPPLSLAMIKRAVNVGLEVDLDSGLDVENQGSRFLGGTEDRQEGIRAFVEKRKPRFQGR